MSFDFIDRKFVQKPKCEPVQPDASALWWCDICGDHVYSTHVTHEDRHAVCDGEVDPYCPDCENGGWIQVHSPCPPAFGECQKCYNPRGYPSP